ncbi:MAG: precorrin-3B C(17)-methyltransferase, partial [Candidatus Omnitrophica bacterium]|nr:precorrin-3B C(17)-methyltransferase [Candidatus Omnitrophota bacterium]
IVIGYKTYIKLLEELLVGREVVSYGMTEEIKRAKYAIKCASDGKNVCVISSGDPGVYGMAGLLLELLTDEEAQKIKVEIIAGIPSASACASLLGAPLMHDFATISLSDLLTDRELINKRVELAAKGDFVIVFYNPKSKKRVAPFKEAFDLLMKYKSPKTPVGIVRNAYRDGEEVIVTELKDMFEYLEKIDMVTTIIIGNSKSYIKGRHIITPRGYVL